MIYNLKEKKDLDELEKLKLTRYVNIDLADYYNEFLKNQLKELSSEAFSLSAPKEEYRKTFFKLSGLKDDKENETLYDSYKIGDAPLLDDLAYRKDSFYRDIEGKEHRDEHYSLGYAKYRAKERFVYRESDSETAEFKEITHLGYFKDDFPYLALKKDGVTWMSIIPHEMNTMKEAIREAKGKVLALGLGLGYYAYHALLKDEVSSLTVVDSDEKIVSIFKDCLLPEFKNVEKLNIVSNEAISFLNSIKRDEFDYIFVDLRHDPVDGLEAYLKIKHILNSFDIKASYRIEKDMIIYLRRFFVGLIEEEVSGSKDSDYETTSTFEDRLFKFLHEELKERKIDSYEDIKTILSSESLLKLSSKYPY
jgi:hypothetical protein